MTFVSLVSELPDRHRNRRGGWVWTRVLLVSAAILLCTATAAHAQISREAALKATYITKFSAYVTWPNRRRADQFVIGVAGRSAVADQLRKLEQLYGDKIKVVGVEDLEDAARCDILYIPSSLARDQQQQLLRGLRGRPVLAIGDSPEFIDDGGVIRFHIQDNRLLFDISRTNATRAGLSISARLLQLARTLY